MNRQQQQPPWAVWVPLQQTLLVLACSAVGWLLLVRRQYQAEQLLEEAGPQQPQQGQDAGQWREQERRQQLRQVQRQRRVDPGLAAELALNRMLFQASHAQRTEVGTCAVQCPCCAVPMCASHTSLPPCNAHVQEGSASCMLAAPGLPCRLPFRRFPPFPAPLLPTRLWRRTPPLPCADCGHCMGHVEAQQQLAGPPAALAALPRQG